MTSIYRDPVTMTGLIVSNQLGIPAGSIKNPHISTTATDRIAAEKAETQQTLTWTTATSTTTLAAVTELLHVANADGTIEQITVRPETIPTGDFSYTVNITKAANGNGSPTSVQSAAITISAADTNYTLENAASIITTTFSKGDAFYVTIAVAGSSGSQGAGATVKVVLNQNAED